MTSRCSMKATIRMALPQRAQMSGSTSYTRLISHAHARFGAAGMTSFFPSFSLRLPPLPARHIAVPAVVSPDVLARVRKVRGERRRPITCREHLEVPLQLFSRGACGAVGKPRRGAHR
jgi:hypothetical protein